MKKILLRRLPLLLTLLLCVGAASCRSGKDLAKSSPLPAGQTTEQGPAKSSGASASVAFVEKVAAQRCSASFLTAKAKVQLAGLGKDLSVSGTLRMKRDDVVQLSLTVFGVEVGRMEFTPADVLVVDRVNKQYVRASYSEVDFLRQAELDFYSLQALFWDELFIPGQRAAKGSASRFLASAVDGGTLLTLTGTPRLSYSFLTDTSAALVTALDVKGAKAGDAGNFSWRYGGFTAFGGRPFPSEMDMTVTGLPDGKSFGLSLRLSRLSSDSGWNTRTTVSAKYQRRTVKDVLGKLHF